MRFLIDECCAKNLTRIANGAGFEAHHVVELGLAGRRDHELRQIILREDFAFVTNNARDFLRIYDLLKSQ